MNAGKVTTLIFGSLFLLVGVVLLIGGGTLVGVDRAFTDADGFLTAPSAVLERDSHAIVGQIYLEDEWIWWWRDPARAQVRMEGDGSIFLGIGPRDEVEAFLAETSYSEIRDVEFAEYRRRGVWATEYFDHVGDAAPEAPSSQAFWVSTADGEGTQTLRWPIEPGDWTLVVMNGDGSRGIDVEGSFGVEAPWLLGLGIGLLAAGLILLGVGLILVLFVARLSRRTEAAGQIEGLQPTESYPVTLTGELSASISPVLWLIKWLLLIPHVFVLAFLWAGFAISWLISLFAILFTGRYPRGLFDYNVGVLRWSWRVAFYSYDALGTDEYPPFSLQPGGYPADLQVRYPERLSPGLALVKWWLLAIPHYIIVGIFQGGAGFYEVGLTPILTFFAGVSLLFTGRYPEELFRLIIGMNRWTFRLWAYIALMTDEYPPFRLEE